MKFTVAATLSSIAVLAFMGAARDVSWRMDPGAPLTLKGSGFVLTARLPRGWSANDSGVVPPEAFGSACTVRSEFFTNREWNHFLASMLHASDAARMSQEHRVVLEVGGHPAVSIRSTIDGKTVRTFVINLSDVIPDSASVWRFEGAQTQDGKECESQFVALVTSAQITRDAGD